MVDFCAQILNFTGVVTLNKTEIRTALSLAAVYVLRMLGLFMVMPVLAVLAKDFPDYSPLLVGLAIGGYGLTQAVLQIPMGVLSDRWGRKPVILFGLSLFCVGSLVAAMADSMLWLTIGRFLQGAGAIAGAIMALAGDVSRDSQRSKVMAIIGIAIGFSFYLAVLLGPIVANHFGLQGIFAITGILALLCMPLVLFVVPSGQHLAPQGDTLPNLADVATLFRDGRLMRLNVGVLLLHMMITLLFVQVPGLLIGFGWQLQDHWLIYLPVLIASIIGLGLLMSMGRKRGVKPTLLLAIGLLLLAFAGLWAEAQHFSWLVALVWLFFTGFNYLEANFPALVSSIAPAGKKGSAMGIYASFQFFGAFLGGLISGSLTQALGSHWVFAIGAGICIIWLLIMKGLNGVEPLKRYTLKVDLTAWTQSQISQRLAGIAGIKDITLVPDSGILYLKVDSKEFSLQQAKQALKVE